MSATPRIDLPALAALRKDLLSNGFTVSGVAERLGDVAERALHREQPQPARQVLRGATDPVAVLTRLFVLGEATPTTELDAALPTLGSAGLLELGLAEPAAQPADSAPADQLRACFDLRPYAWQEESGDHDWWILSDLSEVATGASLRADHVLGVGGASATLAAAALRAPGGRVLDLGTGCGIQALHALAHGGQVVGTDVLPRALKMARFNAALNEVGSLDLRLGSLLEPVADESFDLVVSNPPFVITPELPDHERHVYRDGGLSGDDLVAQLVAQIPQVLAPGGVAVMLGNWEHRAGQDWRERVAAWVPEGIDAWILQREVQDPAQYAQTWLRDGGQVPDAQVPDQQEGAWAQRFEAWLADFASRQVQGVGFGVIVLRRPASSHAEPWRRLEDRRSGELGLAQGGLGQHIRAVLDSVDWLRAIGAAGLEQAHLQVAPDVTEERHYRPGEDDPRVIVLHQGGGLGRAVQVGTAVAAVVGACDGELPLGVLLDAVAQLLERPPLEVATEVLPVVRELVTDGFLVPVAHA